MNQHLILYGVFEGERCIMVGSTERTLQKRIQNYSRFKWFDRNKHEHRVLWEGNLEAENPEHFRFLRAGKETLLISRMKTWYNQGGHNQSNPLLQALGMPYSYGMAGHLYGHLGGKIGGKVTFERGHLNKLHTKEICSKGGYAQPREVKVQNGLLQGRRNAENGHMAAVGRKRGLENKNSGHLFRISHLRWHERRGIKKPECALCQI